MSCGAFGHVRILRLARIRKLTGTAMNFQLFHAAVEMADTATGYFETAVSALKTIAGYLKSKMNEN